LTALLKRVEQVQGRTDGLSRLIQQTDNLSALVHFVEWLEDEPSASPTLSKETLDGAKSQIADKILRAARTGSLVQEPDFGNILFRWRNWAGREDPVAYVAQMVQGSDQDIVTFLMGMTTAKVSSNGGEPLRTIVMLQESVRVLIDPTIIENRVREIKDKNWESLSDKQKTAVGAYLTMAEEWQESTDPLL
jgi:hypothetical protein